MEEKYDRAGRGLKRMFIAQILALVGLVITALGTLWALGGVGQLSGSTTSLGILVGLLGGIVVLVSSILSLVGLLTAREADRGYTLALLALLAAVVFNIIGQFSADGTLMNNLFSALNLAASALSTYFICTASAKLLRARSDERTAAKGSVVWVLTAVGCLLTILGTCLFSSGTWVLVFSVVGLVVSLVASLLYILFLHSGSKSLLAPR